MATNYLKWQEKTINNFSDDNINQMYDAGFVFTRKGKGDMYQTRSVRIDLDKFELSSENRRILKKTEDLKLKVNSIPYSDYSWEIGKLGKDFYEKKFGKGIFSANKIKELLTDENKSNFNKLFVYCHCEPKRSNLEESLISQNKKQIFEKEQRLPRHLETPRNDNAIGYTICLETNDILHYSYPFYQLQITNYQLPPNTGLGMMLKAVILAKEDNKKHIYLGSASSTKSLYKFQFKGIEWFDGKEWKNDINELKNLLRSN